MSNPANRFEPLEYAPLAGEPVEAPTTRYYVDRTQTIIARNESPDVGFSASINPYRGCSHGCAYCYARPTHEYLGLSAGLDFESRIFVKESAPELLRAELAAPSWQPQVIGVSGVTDAYQTIERHLGLTRRCMEVLAECRQPVVVVTKSRLVARDADLLADLARHGAAAVFVSITTLDPELARVMEPRASSPRRRLEAIAELTGAGVPTGVMVAPVVPGLTDHELPAIIKAATDSGARYASYALLRLPHGVKELFAEWLAGHYPGRRDAVLARVRSVRGGKLNDTEFGRRMRGEGVYAEHVRSLFKVAAGRAGVLGRRPDLSIESFRRPKAGNQMRLFD